MATLSSAVPFWLRNRTISGSFIGNCLLFIKCSCRMFIQSRLLPSGQIKILFHDDSIYATLVKFLLKVTFQCEKEFPPHTYSYCLTNVKINHFSNSVSHQTYLTGAICSIIVSDRNCILFCARLAHVLVTGLLNVFRRLLQILTTSTATCDVCENQLSIMFCSA